MTRAKNFGESAEKRLQGGRTGVSLIVLGGAMFSAHSAGEAFWNPKDCSCLFTFDIDWAPDWAVADIAATLNIKGVRGMFFITHPSDVIVDLIRDGHTVGLHPNFLPGSSQGETPEQAIEYLLRLAPEAVCMRTHALVQSSPLLHRIFKAFPQLRYDLSIFMYKFPYIGWFDWKFEGVGFRRLNYNWEDDAAFDDHAFDWAVFRPWAQNIVFDFHPIHVALNSASSAPYNAMKKEMNGKPLFHATRADLAPFVNLGAGARDFIHAVLESEAQVYAFSELT